MDPMVFLIQFIQRLMNLQPSSAPPRARGSFAPNAPEPFTAGLPPRARAPVVSPTHGHVTPTRHAAAPRPVAPAPTTAGGIFNNPYAGTPSGGGYNPNLPGVSSGIVTPPNIPATPYSTQAGNWALRQLSRNQDASATDYANLQRDIAQQGNNFGPPGARYSLSGLMFGPTGPIGGYNVMNGPFTGNPNTYIAPGIGPILSNPNY